VKKRCFFIFVIFQKTDFSVSTWRRPEPRKVKFSLFSKFHNFRKVKISLFEVLVVALGGKSRLGRRFEKCEKFALFQSLLFSEASPQFPSCSGHIRRKKLGQKPEGFCKATFSLSCSSRLTVGFSKTRKFVFLKNPRSSGPINIGGGGRPCPKRVFGQGPARVPSSSSTVARARGRAGEARLGPRRAVSGAAVTPDGYRTRRGML
jgi:hypothetical protein